MKKTKRVLAFLLAVMMWLTALPVGIFAGTESNALVIEADQVSGKAGDTVDMAIRITNNPGVVAFGIKVEYDENVLTLKEKPEVTNLLGGSTTYSEHVTDNPFVAVFENGEAESDVTATGTLMVLSFEIKAGASAGASTVKVSFTESGTPVNYDTATVAGETKNGSITVERGEIRTPCFVVSEASAVVGQEVELTVSVENNPGIVAAELEIIYDADALELVKAEDQGLLAGGTFSENLSAKPYYLSWQQNETAAVNGTLATLTFLVKESGKHSVTLTVKSAQNTDLEPVDFEIVSGSITAQSMTFSVSEETGYPGETVELTLSVENNPGIVAAELELGFDRDALELVGAADAGLLGGYTASQNYTDEPYYVSWMQNDPIAENGTLAILTFLVKEGCVSGKYPVELAVKSVQDTDLKPVTCESIDGTITVPAAVFSVSEATGYPGDTVDLTVDISNNPGIISAELELDFDRDALELKAVKNGNLMSGETFSENLDAKPYYLSWLHNDPVSEDGTLAILTFQIKNGCNYDTYPVSLTVKSAQNTDMKSVGAEALAGAVTVVENEAIAPRFTLSEETGHVGGQVSVTLDISNNPGIVAAELELDYDRNVLELIKAVSSGLMSGETFSESTAVEPYYLSWQQDNPTSENGKLVTLTFRVKDRCAVGDKSVVSVSVKSAVNTDLEDVIFKVTNGSVTVIEHDWQTAVYTWSEDNTVCTAERTCFCGAKETENGTVTSETTEPTCTEAGSTVYTATFTNPVFEKQEKTVVGDPAKEHSWGKVLYIWSADYTTCTAMRTCVCGAKETESGTVTSVVTEATCEEAGFSVYTAIFNNPSFEKQEKRAAGDPAKGHTWSEAIYSWSEDNTVCTAEHTCACGAKETENGVVTSETTDPTCTEEGKTVYTANFTKDGFVDQTLKTVLDALGHNFHIIVDEDGESVRCCKRCGEIDPDYREEKPETKMSVTFRLIGDLVHEDGVEDHEEYVTWIKTTTYTIHSGDTVYDVFVKALNKAGMKSKGASDGYVSAIRAPEVLGGYWLSELDNGPNAGWMYTVNGEHVSETLTEYVLEDGDEILWHYVDDYSKEEKPNSKYYERWLEAEDISPETYVKRRLKDIVDIEGEGEVEPELKVSHIGENVKFTFIPEEGWVIHAVYVDGKSQGAIDSYTYKTLSLDSRIKVVFVKCGEALPVPDLWFLDVGENDWFYDDVYFTVNNGLFNGVSELYFEPNTPMTRAMLITVLYRMEGTPAVNGRSAFTDVQDGQWYTDAVVWATRKGVVNGYGDGRFGPNDPITREQMAAILFRYAGNKGYSVLTRADLTAYTDHTNISGYAMDALSWANANGLIRGRTETTLMPDGQATRAEVAAILHRFLLNIVI